MGESSPQTCQNTKEYYIYSYGLLPAVPSLFASLLHYVVTLSNQ